MSVSHVRSVSCVLRSKSRGIQASLVGSLSGSSSEDHIQAGIATFPASCIVLARALAVNCHFLLDISFVASIGCSVSSATCAAHFIGQKFFGVVVTTPVCVANILSAVIASAIAKSLSVEANVCIDTEAFSLLLLDCTSATCAAHFIGEEFFGVVVTAPVCISSIIKAVIIVVIGKKLSVGVNVCIETETCSLLPCPCTSATRAAH